MDRRHRMCWLASLALAFATPWPATADDPQNERFGRGKRHVGFQAGYGSGLSLGFTGDGDGRKVEYLGLFPRVAVGLSDPQAQRSWYRGNFDLLIEGAFLENFEPRDGHFAGASLLLRYNFLVWKRFVPYVEAGAGMGYLDFDLRDQDDGFSFVLQGGVGLQYFLTERASLDAAWRLHHISNAGIHQPNNGINSSLPLLGFTIHLD